MKKLYISAAVLLIACTTQAQVLYNNGATITINTGAIVQVNGNMTNHAGSIINNGSLTVTGNLLNNASLTTPGGSNLNFNGTTAQTLAGSAPVIAKHVVINNPAGIALATPLRIDGIATFTSGVIDATNSSYPVIFTANGTISGTPTNASHINGYVVKEGVGAFTYPLGNATNYQPVSVNLTANSGGLTAVYVPADAGAGPYSTGGTEATALVQYNTSEYWNLTPIGTATGTVAVHYDGYRVTPISNNTTDLRVAHKVGGIWLNEGRAAGSIGNNISGTIISNAVSTWSPFTFGAVSAVILPLTWLNVAAVVKEQNKAQVSWQVQEAKIKGYTLERSTNGRSFTAVATLVSQGSGTHTYSHTDAAAFTAGSIAYYRIMQQDINGNTSYSKTVQVTTDPSGFISIYPTPFQNSFVVKTTLAQAGTITDNAGKIVAKLQLLPGSNTIRTQNWATGTYYLTTSSGETFKLLKN